MKASRILLAIIATILIYWMCFALFSCTTANTVLPTCDWIQVTQIGDKLHLKITSQSPSVTYTRDYKRSFKIGEHYYQCVSIDVEHGEVITFTDRSECILVAR